MDVEAVKRGLKAFIRTHRTAFDDLAKNASALLEIGALSLTAQHYARSNYTVVPRNLQRGNFRVKTSSSGWPLNFSYFEASDGSRSFEIHSNLKVEGAYRFDRGVYVVDVAVVEAGCIPEPTPKTWRAIDNDALKTFVEAKKLVIYPMLLAQFIGIVHEIKPEFIGGRRPYGFLAEGHFDPALVSIQYLQGVSAGIERAFPSRGIKVRIIPAFDLEIARLRGDPNRPSPFA